VGTWVVLKAPPGSRASRTSDRALAPGGGGRGLVTSRDERYQRPQPGLVDAAGGGKPRRMPWPPARADARPMSRRARSCSGAAGRPIRGSTVNVVGAAPCGPAGLKRSARPWAAGRSWCCSWRTAASSSTPTASGGRSALKRKTSPFAESDGGARHQASLVATARLNRMVAQAWLADLLERVASGRTKAHELERLLPWSWKAERPAATVAARTSRRSGDARGVLKPEDVSSCRSSTASPRSTTR